MPMPDYRIRSAPQLQQQQGPLGALGDFAKSKALSAGLEAAFPGGGLAKEAAEAVVPTFLAAGGAPLGGGQSKEGLMQARQLGALSQEEFLAAMKHAGYLEEGGKVPWWKKAAEYVWKNENQEKKQQKAKKKFSKGDVGSIVGSLFETGGTVKPAYQRMGGLTEGPLGMSDMLQAGKGKDVSKVMYKKKGGSIEDQVEISYHAPLAPKPKGE